MPVTIHRGNVTINKPMTIATVPVAAAPTGYATGGTVYDITGYKVHIFTSSDTFATTSIWPSGHTIEYEVVAGGGGGSIGGGGAGGLLTSNIANVITVTSSTNYSVTVGAGGAGSNTGTVQGTNGGNSSFIGASTSLISIGGGGGGTNVPSNGSNGGSGGGAGVAFETVASGGTKTSGQGNDGAASASNKIASFEGAGGGYSSAGVGVTGGGGYNSLIYKVPATGTYDTSIYEFGSPTTSANTFTFTVSTGLYFTANTPVQLTANALFQSTKFGYIVSYSGTTLVMTHQPAGNYTNGSASQSSWFISCLLAGGGGRGIPAQDYSSGDGKPGGGGGRYNRGQGFTPQIAAGINTGGGGSVGQFDGFPADVSPSGGSGVVMIKYAYP